MRPGTRLILFYALVLAAFLASLWLRFVAGGTLRGNAYDVILVFVLASATFSTRNQLLLRSTADTPDPDGRRRRQAALNRTSVAAVAGIAGGAEIVQGLLHAAAGRDVMGRFDVADLACYLAGAALSFAANRLLYDDAPDRRPSNQAHPPGTC